MRNKFKYQIHPTDYHHKKLLNTVELLRQFYNLSLAEKIETYEKTGKSISLKEQSKGIRRLKVIRPEYNEIYSSLLNGTLYELDLDYKRFFKSVRTGGSHPFPTPKVPRQYSNLTYYRVNNSCAAHVKECGTLLSISKVGKVPIKVDQPLKGHLVKAIVET